MFKVRFSPTVARYVREKTWQRSQKLTPQPTAGLLAEFRLRSTEELKSWVLTFGKEERSGGNRSRFDGNLA